MYSAQAQRDEELREILREYGEFRLCRELGCLPEDLDEQPAARVLRWQMMLSAETEAEAWLIERAQKGGR